MDAAWIAQETVLIHCREGRNRSAALLIGWLMSSSLLSSGGEKGGKRLDAAYGSLPVERTLRAILLHVKQIRALVDPNIGFLKQLLDLENSLSKGA